MSVEISAISSGAETACTESTSPSGDLEFHPLADIFPMMSPEERKTLGRDIAATELRDSIKLYQGRIVDGRNRYLACQEHCPDKMRFETVEGTVDDVIQLVTSLNLHRRHLNDSQRAMIAERLATTKLGDNQHAAGSEGSSDDGPSISRTDAARIVGTSTASIDRARQVRTKAAPEVVAAVEAGQLRLNTAAKASELPKDQQVAIAEAAVRGGNQEAVKALREVRESVVDAVPPGAVPPEEPREPVDSVTDIMPPDDMDDVGVGRRKARAAIEQLQRIPRNDLLLDDGLALVTGWIKEHGSGKKQLRANRMPIEMATHKKRVELIEETIRYLPPNEREKLYDSLSRQLGKATTDIGTPSITDDQRCGDSADQIAIAVSRHPNRADVLLKIVNVLDRTDTDELCRLLGLTLAGND